MTRPICLVTGASAGIGAASVSSDAVGCSECIGPEATDDDLV